MYDLHHGTGNQYGNAWLMYDLHPSTGNQYGNAWLIMICTAVLVTSLAMPG